MVSSRAPTGTGATDNAGIDNTGWSLAPAAADYDLDGDVDLFVGNDFGKDVLYRNDGTGHFDEVARAVGAIGAVVTVHVGGERQTRHVAAGSGFLASSSPVLHFGLGEATAADRLEIQWPSGGRETHVDVAANQPIALRQTQRGE